LKPERTDYQARKRWRHLCHCGVNATPTAAVAVAGTAASAGTTVATQTVDVAVPSTNIVPDRTADTAETEVTQDATVSDATVSTSVSVS